MLSTMLSTPPVPSASYFAPGLVTTSMLFTIVAGMALNICEALLVYMGLSLPST